MKISKRPIHRRGFTLIELLVAGLITAFVLSSVTMSLSQLGSAKTRTKMQLEAYLRADSALNALRRNLASVVRSDDLFWTRLLVEDAVLTSEIGPVDRDEILVFNTVLRPVRDIDFIGEGMEYETHYRIEEDDSGAVLWQRRDPVPDEYPRGGGIAFPLVEGLISLTIAAYDGNQWYDEWDSDIDGLPLALRVTVVASGYAMGDDPYTAPMAVLRTVIPIDRVSPPANELDDEEELDDELGAPQDGTGGGGAPSTGGGRPGGRGDRPRPGGNRTDEPESNPGLGSGPRRGGNRQ